jgi:hypothetical protein
VITEVARDDYLVTFRREPGDQWPDLEPKKIRYRVTEMSVTVAVDREDGQLHPGQPEITRARRVRPDGSMSPGGPQARLYYDIGADESVIPLLTSLREAALAAVTAQLAGPAGPPPLPRPGFCQVLSCQARHLMAGCVIRLRDGQVQWPDGLQGPARRGAGRWREVLNVFTDRAAMEAMFGPELRGTEATLADFAFEDHESWMVLDLLMDENSDPGQIDDKCVVVRGVEPIDVLSTPATRAGAWQD